MVARVVCPAGWQGHTHMMAGPPLITEQGVLRWAMPQRAQQWMDPKKAGRFASFAHRMISDTDVDDLGEGAADHGPLGG